MTATTKLPFVFILGMHRSGTSCLAGALEQCGLHLGAVRRTGRYNPKGYFENKSIQRMHDQILGLNKGNWHQPPKKVKAHPYYQQQFAEIDAHLSKRRPCGLKDPRLLLMLDTWLTAVKKPHALVGTFRHPLAVAKSLVHRNGIPINEGIKLWISYNQRLMEYHQANPFPLLEYDLTNTRKYISALIDIAKKLNLVPAENQLHHFVTPHLEHQHSIATVPSECQVIYRYLQHAATV